MPKSSAQDSPQPADGSPFAVLLAATAPTKPKDRDAKSAAPRDNSAPADPEKAMAAAKPNPAKSKYTGKSRNAGKADDESRTADAGRSRRASKTPETKKAGDVAKSDHAEAQTSAQTASKTPDSTPPGDKADGNAGGANDNDKTHAQIIQTADAAQPAAQPDPNSVAQAEAQAQTLLAAQSQVPQQTDLVPANEDSSDDQQVAAAATISANQTSAPAAGTPASSRAPQPEEAASSGDAPAPVLPSATPRATAPAPRTKQVLQATADQNVPDKAADSRPAPQTASADPVSTSKPPAQPADHAIPGAGDSKTILASNTPENPAAPVADPAAAPPQPAAVQPPQPQPPSPGAANIAALSGAAPVQPFQAANTGPGSSVHLSAPASGAAPDIDGLAVAIAARSQSGAKQFDIRLDPPELGRVEVRLSIDANGKAQAHMTADQPATLSLLQKDSTTLTQALRDAGLDVSQDGLNFSLRGQSGQQGQSGDDGQGRAMRGNFTASRVIDSVQSAPSSSFTGGGNSRLDIHV